MEAESVGRLLGSIYSAHADDGHWSGVISHLLDLSGAEVGAIFSLDKTDGAIVSECMHFNCADDTLSFPSSPEHTLLNPSQRLLRHFQHPKFSSAQDLYHIRSDVNACVVKINDDGNTANFVAAGCLAPRDAANVANVLTFVRPHMARSLQRAKERETQRMDDLLEIMPVAALILTARGEILRTNPQMDALLAEGDGVWRDGCTLKCFLDQIEILYCS